MRVRLLPGERVLVRTRPNPLPLVGPVLAGFLLLAVGGFALGYLSRRDLAGLAEWQPLLLLLALAAVVLLLLRVVVRPLVRWSSNRYILTSMRLIHRRGATRRTEHQINLSAISQLQTEQGLLQRMVGSGTLVADLGFDRSHAYRDVPQLGTFKEYMVQAISELPLTRMFDGVDMEIDPEYARGGAPWAQQEWRGERS
ncbi:PH domain-containing protein [Arthrobacter sp. NPDC092385]|uniref:PH domain-containing protein n=1 Tax=Arthrobacter sp. NPDC092385 TaxID=3363943 RepID=UPI00382463D5